MSALPITQFMSAKQWALLSFLSLLWGCAFIFMELALMGFPALTIVFGRTFLGAVTLFTFCIVTNRKLSFSFNLLKKLIVSSFVGLALPFSLIVWGQVYITASLASVLNGTMPLFSVLLAHFLTSDERLKRHKLMGVVVGFVGVAVIVGPSAFASSQGVWGQIALLGAAFCYAWSTIYRRQLSRLGARPMVSATAEVILASLMLLPLVLLIDQPWNLPAPPAISIWAIVFLGAFSTGLAFVIYHTMLPQVGANNMSLVTFLIPISAIAMGVVFLGEVLTLNQIAGMALVGLGLMIIDGRLLKLSK